MAAFGCCGEYNEHSKNCPVIRIGYITEERDHYKQMAEDFQLVVLKFNQKFSPGDNWFPEFMDIMAKYPDVISETADQTKEVEFPCTCDTTGKLGCVNHKYEVMG